MEIRGKKVEFDFEELFPLLIGDKQEGFRKIGEQLLNAVLEKEFESFIGASKHERSDERTDYRNNLTLSKNMLVLHIKSIIYRL